VEGVKMMRAERWADGNSSHRSRKTTRPLVVERAILLDEPHMGVSFKLMLNIEVEIRVCLLTLIQSLNSESIKF
jgi:hypothetical protein